MKYLGAILIILTAFALFDARACHSHEWGPMEGHLKNLTSEPTLCLWDDLEGKLCGKWVSPGKWCRGDAMYVAGTVFKIPNRTAWECTSLQCQAVDLRSYLIFEAARIKNGFDLYGEMSMEEFKTIMWDWSIDLCE